VTPGTFLQQATAGFLILALAVVVYRILTGGIQMAGLLYERGPSGRLVYSPARLQLILVTIMGAVQYLSRFTHSTDKMPGVDALTLSGLGGSQVFYLASKAWAAFQARKS
jgi:hypothetical protein